MNKVRSWVAASLIGLISFHALAIDDALLQAGVAYKDAKTWHEQFMQGGPTKAERLDAIRSLVLASPVRARGLEQIYRNFDGRYSIDPTIPGVEKSVLMQLSSSKQQAKGYRREVLYAIAYHNDPRFSLVEMNRPLRRTWGNTDADLVIQHHQSGQSGRIEVKDYSVNSQRTNLSKLKVQIDKMSLEGRMTGQLQFWMNARPVIPSIYQYGEKSGVLVSGNVKTGRTVAPGAISIAEAMNHHEKQFVRANLNRASIGAGGLAYAAWGLKNSVPLAVADIREAWDPETRSTQSLLRLGEHGSAALGNGAMGVSGTTLTAARFATESLQSRLYMVGKAGGVASIAAIGLSEAFLVTRYVRGDVLGREFWTEQWVAGTSTIGSMAGGGALWLIAKNPWSAFAGASAGNYLGNDFGTRTARRYYEYKFGELDKAYGIWVYSQYAIR